MKKKITVVSKSDERFFNGLVVLINSLNYIETSLNFHIIDFGLNHWQHQWLKDRGCTVQKVVPKYFPHQSTISGTHYNESIYALLYLENIESDVIVHFDADIIVIGGLVDFIDKLKEFDFVAPIDYPPLPLANQIGSEYAISFLKKKFGEVTFDDYTVSMNSINAGIWAVSAEKFKILRNVMIELYNDCNTLGIILPMRDQSLLNIALIIAKFRVCKLDVEYNFRAHFRRAPDLRATYIDDSIFPPQIIYNEKKVCFIHFIGSKPWESFFKGDERLKNLWENYHKNGFDKILTIQNSV